MNSGINILSKKNSKDARNFKTDGELKFHFIERLNERYGILLTDEEYIDIHNPNGFTNSKTIEEKVILWAKISSNTSVYIIKLKGKLVLVIYSKRRGRFITALPWHSYDDETRFVPKILKKQNLKEFSIRRYNEILSICAKEYVDFGNITENWHYYQKCTYPKLLMLEFKGYLTVGQIYEKILEEFKKTENDLIETI
jgi:hypothetical protein